MKNRNINSKVNIIFDTTLNHIIGKFENDKMVFEIDYQGFGYELKIHFMKVYVEENKGYGSFALDELEKFALKNNYRKIFGELVNGKDSSEPSKLIHFYIKNQYNIENTGEDYVYARISKFLV